MQQQHGLAVYPSKHTVASDGVTSATSYPLNSKTYSYSGAAGAGAGPTSRTSGGLGKTKMLPPEDFPHPRRQQQHGGVTLSPSLQSRERSVGVTGTKSVNPVNASSESYSYSNSKSGSGSYSYSYSSEQDEDKSSDGDEGETASSSYSYSYSSDLTMGSKETAPPGPSDTRHLSASSTGTSTYTYSGSASRGEDSGTYESSYSSGYSGSNVSGSDVSYSYSYSRSTNGRTDTETGTRTSDHSERVTTSSTVRESGSTDATTRSTDASSYSYSYSYSNSSNDKVRFASRRHGSMSSTGSTNSKESLSQSDSQTRNVTSPSYSSQSSSTISTTTSRASIGKGGKKLLPPPRQTTESSTASITTTTTTSLIKCSNCTPKDSSTMSYSDSTSSYTRDGGDVVTGTTSSSVMDETDRKGGRESKAAASTERREVVILSAVTEEVPFTRSLNHSCLVPRGSINDTLSQFLNRLSEVQAELLRRNAGDEMATRVAQVTGTHTSASADTGAVVTSDEKPKKKKKALKVTLNDSSDIGKQVQKRTSSRIPAVVDVPPGHFVKKSLAFALKAVGVRTAEARASAMKNVSFPFSRDAMLSLLDTHAHQTLMRRLMAMILAHDKFCSGEVSLATALDILGRSGIAYRVIGDITLSIFHDVPRGRCPLLCVTQRIQHLQPPVATVEGHESSLLEVQVEKVAVDVCSAALQPGGADVYWDDQKGDVYIGSRVVAKRITSRQRAKELFVQLEAFIHVCLVVDAHIVNDSQQCNVVYSPFLVALLPLVPDGVPNTRSIIVENAIASVVNPMKHLEGIAAHRRLQERYLGDGEDAALSDVVLGRRVDVNGEAMVEQHCQGIDWAPRPSADGNCFESTPACSVNDVYCDVGILKLHLGETMPTAARCYCLVSARKASSGEWMPAVMVPVVAVTPSKRGGFKWTFNKSSSDRVFFAGGRADTLYIEACYDVHEATGELVTWCAGHATMMCCGARSGKLPMLHGSLLSDTESITTEEKRVGPSRRFCSFFSRKVTANPAMSIAIVVKSVNLKTLPPRKNLPARYLALRRHVPLMAQLRDAIMSYSDPCGTPLQVLRQQWVQSCFTLAAKPELMDVLQQLWDRTLHGKLGAKPKDALQNPKLLLALVAKVAAVYNSIAGDPSVIVDIVARGAAIPFPISPQAPQRPVCV